MKYREFLRKKNIVPAGILSASFLLRAYYVSYISVLKNQHDGGAPWSEGGHLGYISYFLSGGSLPDFDVRFRDQFWHPPLHYALSAGFLKAVWKVFPGLDGNFEAVQVLPLLYVTAAMALIGHILYRLIPEKDREARGLASPGYRAFLLAFLFVCFQPGLVIRSAFVNNDALVLLLSVLALDLAIMWHRNPGAGKILAAAAAFGLAMSTKKSAALMALPVGFLFADRFFRTVKERGRTGKLLGQFALFLAAAVPLSLWWYVRNRVLYGVPFDFIWIIDAPETYEAYLGDIPALQRLLDFRPVHFTYYNTYMQYGRGDAQDINPLIAFWKTAASDLWSWSYADGRVKKLSYALFILRTLTVTAAAVFGIPALLFRMRGKREEDAENKEWISLLLLFASQLASFYVFSFRFPFVWSMDYRYVEVILAAEAAFVLSVLITGEGAEKEPGSGIPGPRGKTFARTAMRLVRRGIASLVLLSAAVCVLFFLTARMQFV